MEREQKKPAVGPARSKDTQTTLAQRGVFKLVFFRVLAKGEVFAWLAKNPLVRPPEQDTRCETACGRAC